MLDTDDVTEAEPTAESDAPEASAWHLDIPWTDVIRWATAFVFTLVGAVSLIANYIHAAGNDAVFSESAVLRAIRFGGTYYQNGIHPKGPLEEVAHDIAARVGGYDGHWYVISVMIAISSAIIAYAAARTAKATGANNDVALGIAAVVFIHFTLGDSAYAGILYSRNILVTLLALAWLLTLEDRPWQGSRRVQLATGIATGVLLGLAVQTIIPAVFDAAVIGGAALYLLWVRIADQRRRIELAIVTVGSGAIGLLSAPIWYLLRGGFSDFWAGWWTYASYQNTGIGLSLGQQFSRGWHNAYSYYQHRPLVFWLIATFVAVTVMQWDRFDVKARVVHLALLGWLLTGWVELILGERYSTHYFSVIAAPTAMIGAALAGHAFTALRGSERFVRFTVAVPLIAVLLSFYLSSGTAHRLQDASDALSAFTSIRNGAVEHRATQSANERSVQAVLDLVSKDLDPMLVYDDNQYIYPDFRRIPATRYQQRYFLIGSIYLGRTSEKYVLPHTWEKFAADVRQANPAAFLQTETVDSRQFSDFTAAHFKPVFTGGYGTVQYRDDIADELLHGTASTPWSTIAQPDSDQGWKIDGSSATYAKGARAAVDDRLLLATGCTRIDGTLDAAGGEPHVAFHFDSAAGPGTQLVLDGNNASARDAGGNTQEVIATNASPGRVPFSLVVGKRAAALVVDGVIVAATDKRSDDWPTLESDDAQLSVRDLRTGPPLPGSC